jgi:hypothetical protein
VVRTVLLVAVAHVESFPVRIALVSALQLGYVGAVAVHVRR